LVATSLLADARGDGMVCADAGVFCFVLLLSID
jgi:hypothetical protein